MRQTTNEAYLIDLSFLQKNGSIVRNEIYNGVLTWTKQNSGDKKSINYFIDYTDSSNIFMLISCQMKKPGGEWYPKTQKIKIIETPSNLGFGKVLFFICPTTGNRCRKLYRAWGADEWGSREAFTGADKLFYPIQLQSNTWKPNTRYHQLKDILFSDNTQRNAYDYAGKETKRARRRRKLVDKFHKVAEKRDEILEECYKKMHKSI